MVYTTPEKRILRSIKESFSPRAWACRLGWATRWSAEIDADIVRVRAENDARASVLDVSLRAQRGWIWSSLHFEGTEIRRLRGLSHQDAARFVTAISHAKAVALKRLEADLGVDEKTLVPLWQDVVREHSADRYLTARERATLLDRIAAEKERLDGAFARSRNPHAKRFTISEELKQAILYLRTLNHDGDRLLRQRNDEFVERELERWRGFFAYCEERALTDEQARAAITFEENTLLIAAAGSGKTSTVVGKVAYALVKGIVRPEEILCLAFNGKAAAEIAVRTNARLRAMIADVCPIDPAIKNRVRVLVDSGVRIESRTFHSLGRKIVEQVEGRGLRLSESAENAVRLKRAVERCKKEPKFAADWLLLQSVARFPNPPVSRFHSEVEYLEYLRGMWRQRKLGYKDKEFADGILTMGCTKPVRSFEEVAISNWLFVNGIDFEYEAAYAEGAEKLCPGATWTPDFTYGVQGTAGVSLIVHEHFALDENGEAPKFFKNPKGYAKEADRKKRILSGLDARHFWTTSAEFRDGTLFDKLRVRLLAAGIVLRPRSSEEVLAKLKDIGVLEDFDLVARAVSQIRQNGWDHQTLVERLAEQSEPARARLFLQVVWPVAMAVNELLKADKCIDYDEMIRRALGYLHDRPDLLPYRFILADEFQDTAPGRGDMIRKMLHAREDSLFFAVGDDWQAINRFAGSDLRFFREFGSMFNRRAAADKQCALTQTFRSNQGIADVGRTFVLRNGSQMPKTVEAYDRTREAVIDVRTYKAEREPEALINEILTSWVSQHPPGRKPSVFILGRYGKYHAGGLTAQQLAELDEKWADRIELLKTKDKEPPSLYTTMHTSKGLQADYVLIVGMYRAEHDFFCFPSEREDDPLLQLVLPPKEALSDADERRLFYVALTRAKHRVALLTQQQYPSPYVLELLHTHRDGTVLFNGTQELPPQCPQCDHGLGFKQYNPAKKKWFYACTDRWGCGTTWSL
ncbi:UvrD-helicase domain-containing protein [Burkholderia cenocepacia]|uniref:UvrD-helicase domain-containing protein n=1 Tax=Burkholderia cenocepacia TaxID=95486 RepID=UPI0002AC0891|nr:UvrD-helicase domain-containing protein [Burkholderia cenocepacia]EPZ86795.1 DNA helicase IV/RNA helicase N-terminal domain protein [Burkholderia cenocepacia K56-2Valvano]ERI30708.1 DNA helicase IV/RNA helicase N-terminal domain protein [Burkholderia cenocepacia BC7]ONR54132.1 DNA helicase IV [Burkholderia cenocepacia]ONR69450.1 DNA helicase IV [Burkholderia cenocepacia]ONR72012.1 DNA helicase IV [Burkholderia cenocepacia]